MPRATRKFVWVTDENPISRRDSMIYQKDVVMCHIMTPMPVKMNHKKTLMSHMNQALIKEVVFNPKPSASKKGYHSRSRSVQMPTQQHVYMALH